MYKHILIATDGSELAGKAVSHGLDLAKTVNAKVTLLTVSEPMWSAVPGEMAITFPHAEYEKAINMNADRIFSAALDVAKAKHVSCTAKHAKDQFPADAIVGAAQEHGCDLIVMGSHGRRGIAKLVLGSQAVRVVSSSTIPVLIYRQS